MHRKPIMPTAGVLFLTLVLAGCGSQESTATQPPEIPAVVETAVTPTEMNVSIAIPTTTESSDNGAVSFSDDVLPLLQNRCSSCHGGLKTEEGLNLRSYEAVIVGSELGLVVIPGEAVNSKLAILISEGKMPKRGPKLTPAQVQLIIDWINAGALNN